ncbi:hypothetical protein MNBD_PLANCTO03-35 [hydrothermal vent metagenome]|uniref:Uncharacterized protein n=1 Tax=hydrothermal vent metagenome TaxID=652676 RepID=A0A3B1DD87_9ZZZZ
MRTHQPTVEFFDALERRLLLSDDHANLPDYGNATLIPLLEGGNGYTYSSEWAYERPGGEIEVPDDNDLFKFIAPGDTDLSIMAVVQADLGVLAPAVELRDADGTLLISNSGIRGLAFLIPNFTLQNGNTYYLVVRGDTPAGEWESSQTGSYWISISMDINNGFTDNGDNGEGDDTDGGTGDGTGDDEYEPDDFADDIRTAFPLSLNSFTADAAIEGGLQTPNDSDAFSMLAPASGPLRIQVLSDDPDLTANITLLDSRGATIVNSDRGLPGTKATLEFATIENEQYTIVVNSPDGTLGDYQLDIDASPTLFHYFYPAGYSTTTIDEFVPMVNPNEFEVEYTILARYEVGDPVQVLDTGVLAPNSRGGITVTSRRDPGGSLTRTDTPYAFEVIASGPIGVNLGHYDFGVTTGEAFTDTLSTRWEFPEVRREEGMRDLLVYYNPNKQATTLWFTLLDERGIMHRFSRTLDAERRGGINLSNDAAIPGDGVYAVWIDSEEPIVAAQTTFDIANGRGDGNLGQPDTGATAGAFAVVSTEPGTDARISLLNSSGESAVVRFTSPALAQPFILTIPARSRLSIVPRDLGFAEGISTALLYTSTAPITARLMQYRYGDGDAALAATQAATTWLIGAAWVNPKAEGTYIEELGLVNPSLKTTEITISFMFTDGSSDTATLTLAGGSGTAIRIDQHDIIVRRGEPTAFSIAIESNSPIIASFSHYDLYLNGGWGTLAAPIGLTVPLNALNR